MFGLAVAAPSLAIDWERMVMPGPLVAGHEKLEKDCVSCHQAFASDAQRSLCLACHEFVAADLAKGEGFHSRNSLASAGQCRSCHPDHLGRNADIRGLSEATFDHRQTDYLLKGRHESTACADCHDADVPRRDTPADCISCHREEDSHKGALGEDCGECHNERAWLDTQFDHDATDYPLTGAHESASCGGCHISERYENTPQDCVSCHAIDDAHAGNFGSSCADCHGTESWVQKGFDHEKESGFALVGAHGKSSCASCHRQPPGERKLPETCTGCHASDDIHASRFGNDCSRCHSPNVWRRAKFDHDKETDFPISGAHAETACNTCHTERLDGANEIATDCYSCHRQDDVHKASLGTDCAGCHSEKSFSEGVLFDHELTRFPLLGLHAIAACESCHPSQAFSQTKIDCRSCHGSDDIHKGSIGTDCGRCHNPNGWAIWRFDHGAETGFALHGQHDGLQCAACHRSPMSKRAKKQDECIDCHASEDAHRGEFGRSCGDCHNAAAWTPAAFGRGRGASR